MTGFISTFFRIVAMSRDAPRGAVLYVRTGQTRAGLQKTPVRCYSRLWSHTKQGEVFGRCYAL